MLAPVPENEAFASPIFEIRSATMDGLTFRKANPDELDLLVKARVDYCLREHADIGKAERDRFCAGVREWTERHVAKGDYVGYYGYLNGELACFAGLLLIELPPIVPDANRTQGYVLSFFTYPRFRRRGIGNELMQYMIHDAKAMGIPKLVLIATDDGVPVYRKNGFAEPSMLYMERKL